MRIQKSVLLTRSSSENFKIAKHLLPRNIPCYEHPLLEQHELSFDWEKVNAYDLLVITSKFAAFMVQKSIKHEISCFVVGAFSAEILSQNPLIKVVKVFQNVSSLICYLLHQQDFLKTAYLSGDIITAEMPTFVDRYQLYHTKYATKLSNELQMMIKNMEIKAIVLYSKNSARTFLQLCVDAQLLGYLKEVVALALSQQVGNGLAEHFAHVICCSKPDNAEMLKLIQNLYTNP